MHHTTAVRFIEGICDLRSIPQHVFDRQRPSFESLRQHLAVDILHYEKQDAVLIPNVVQRTNMRMVQARDHFSLALKALPQS